MSEDKDTAKTVTSALLISIPFLMLALYFGAPVVFLIPFKSTINKGYGPPKWIEIVFTPVIVLNNHFKPYREFIEWQSEKLLRE